MKRMHKYGAVAGLIAAIALPGLGVSTVSAETIRFGMTSALTGPFNEFGEGNRRAVMLAVEQWNERGGINGQMIEIEPLLDDQLNPDRALQNMRRILDDDRVVGIIGPAGSGPTLAVIEMAAADGRPYMNPIAQTPDITYPDGIDAPPRRNVFSFALQNDVESVAMGQHLAANWEKIGIIHESTAYGVTGVDYLVEALIDAGGSAPVAVESYNQGAQDVTAQIQRLRRSGAEVIAAIGLGADMAVVRRAMARLNFNVPLVASNGALGQPFQDGARELAVGVQGTMIGAFGERPMREATQAFADAYKAKYGTDRWWGNDEEYPQLFMAISVSNAYDAANILFEGVRRAGSTDPDAIIDAIESIEGWEGANAVYTFTPDRHHAIEVDGLSVFEYRMVNDSLRLFPINE